MVSNEVLTIIAVNIALFSIFSGILLWSLNKIDGDIKSVGSRVDSISSRMDGHATRIDQLYRMFVDLVKSQKP